MALASQNTPGFNASSAVALAAFPQLTGPGRVQLPSAHPDQRARRWLQIQYPAQSAAAHAALIQKLNQTGLFEKVEPVTGSTTEFSGTFDQLTLNSTTDPHHRQYAFPQLKLGDNDSQTIDALDITQGRVLIGVLDSGLNPNEPELQNAFRPQWSASADVAFVNNQFVFSFNPGSLNPADLFVAHGLLVSGILVSRWDSAGASSAIANSGTVGVCPGCSLSMMRLLRSSPNQGAAINSMQKSYEMLGLRLGASVINHSGNTGRKDEVSLVSNRIAELAARDVVMVAASGNDGNIGGANKLVPGGDPLVYMVGATDQFGRNWNDWNIRKNYPLSAQHPHVQRAPVLGIGASDGRCGNGDGANYAPLTFNEGTSECGSNIGSSVAFMAPGAQILGLVDRTFIPLGTINPQPGCAPPLNCFQSAPLKNNLGSQTQAGNTGYAIDRPFANTNYTSRFGAGTGTSFAAPHVAGIAALVRSVNPLLATKIATDPRAGGPIGIALSASATPVLNDGSDPQTGCTGPNLCGAGIPNAVAALHKTLGSIRALQLNNRLTPVFQLRNDPNAAFAEPGLEKEVLATPETWLSTTSPQVAMAAIDGKLYFTGADDANNDFGTDLIQTYKAGYENTSNQAHVMPASQYRHRLWGNGAGSTQLPFASFYLHTTEKAPAGSLLKPLYRMSSKCFGIRKHFYTTETATRDLYAGGPAQVGTPATGCITGPNSTDRGYFYDGVEGYVLATQLPGTVALTAGYYNAGAGSANSGWAIYTSDEAFRFGSYNSNMVTLGYVYPAVSWTNGGATYQDQDNDGLSDGYEIAMGLNEQAANSDCEGSDDGVEFPIAGISPSDPMDVGSCADLRLTKQGDDFLVSNPVGPAVAQNVIVRFEYLVQTIPSNPAAALPITPSGWSCGFVAAPPNSPMDLQVYECTIPSAAVSLNALFDLSPGLNPLLVAPTLVKVTSSTNDPVPGNNNFP